MSTEDFEEPAYVPDEEEDLLKLDSEEVIVLLCILHNSGNFPENKRIWRRIAVPANFSLLELHVSLQNAFSWENTHLHDFLQPRESNPSSYLPYAGFGRTDVLKIDLVDFEQLNEAEQRSFQPFISVDIDSEADMTTPALPVAKEAPTAPRVVFVKHSHPHLLPNDPPFISPPKQVLEERAFIVRDVLSASNPTLYYEYDFVASHEVTILFQGLFSSTEGVNYPTCLAGQGASRAEDCDDMDEKSNLLSSYDYDSFSVQETLLNFEHTYGGSWPLGPDAESNLTVPRCYMCRFNRECARRSTCSGSCCEYCLKSEIASYAGQLELSEADKLFIDTAKTVEGHRAAWIADRKCGWVESDGQPCLLCGLDEE